MYEVKKNWTGVMTTATNEDFIGLQPENFYLVVGIKIWWGSLLGEISKFLASGGILTQSPVINLYKIDYMQRSFFRSFIC